MADLNAIESKVKSDIGWLKNHQNLVIVVLVLATVLFLGNKFLDHRVAVLEQRAIVAEETVKQDKQLIANLQDQVKTANKAVADAKADYDKTKALLQAENAKLVNAIAARNDELAHQQHIDNTAPLPQVAERVKTLAGLQPEDMSVAGSNVIVSEPGTRQIASKLEELPVLKGNLADTQKIADNRQTELDKANAVIGVQNTSISKLTDLATGQAKTIADQDKSCKAQVDSAKAASVKSKRNWFIGGVLTGAALIARLVL